MKKGQGWAKRVTLENLSSFANYLLSAEEREASQTKFAEDHKNKVSKSHAPYLFQGVALHFSNRFSENRRWLEVVQLPPYSPEFNATEPLWHHTRAHATHNTCFENVEAIMESLTRVFTDIQKNPNQIIGYLKPFQ